MDYSYICVYQANETDFSGNGLRILYPTECTVTETLNGEYSLSLSHPVDEHGSWKFIKEHNILKARGQLFRIYATSRSMARDGTFRITAEALHIFYDLNFYFIRETNPVLRLPDDALEWITSPSHGGEVNILNGDPRKRFNFFTDLDNARFNPDNYHTAYYEKMSVTRALIGDENCFVNTWGGELRRDNFNVSILDHLGDKNSFDIKYGVDMIEIQENTDLSCCASSLYYEATVYNEVLNGSVRDRSETVIFGTVNGGDTLKLPVQPMAHYEFEVDLRSVQKQPDEIFPSVREIKKECERRALRYLMNECRPRINFAVKFADLKQFDLYKDFVNLQKCKLGDIGTVYHEVLGIDIVQRIIKRTVDAITGETLSIELGNTKRKLTDRLARE